MESRGPRRKKQEQVAKGLSSIVVRVESSPILGGNMMFLLSRTLLEDKQQAKFRVMISHHLCYMFCHLLDKNPGKL